MVPIASLSRAALGSTRPTNGGVDASAKSGIARAENTARGDGVFRVVFAQNRLQYEARAPLKTAASGREVAASAKTNGAASGSPI